MNFLSKILTSFTFLFVVSCSDATSNEDRSLQSRELFVQKFDQPVFIMLDEEGGPASEFGYSAQKGWHWIDHRKDHSSMPDLGIGHIIDPEIFDFDISSQDQRSLPTSTVRASAYSASTIPRSFSNSLAGPVQFGLIPISDRFSSSLGSGGQCSLTKLCDVALSLCENLADVSCEGIDRCYAEIYRIELPPEIFTPFFCWLLDIVECVSQNGESACGL